MSSGTFPDGILEGLRSPDVASMLMGHRAHTFSLPCCERPGQDGPHKMSIDPEDKSINAYHSIGYSLQEIRLQDVFLLSLPLSSSHRHDPYSPPLLLVSCPPPARPRKHFAPTFFLLLRTFSSPFFSSLLSGVTLFRHCHACLFSPHSFALMLTTRTHSRVSHVLLLLTLCKHGRAFTGITFPFSFTLNKATFLSATQGSFPFGFCLSFLL